MKRTKTKPKSTNSLASNSRHIATQTESFGDSFLEVAKLEEQVRLLQLENNVLRKHVERSSSTVYKPTVQTTPSGYKTNCKCRGNCATRICGCVKKSGRCNSSCKCDDKLCQNKKSECDQENKENINELYKETPKKQTGKKSAVEKIKYDKSLFSPDTKQPYKHLEEGQFSGIEFSFNKNTVSKDSQIHSSEDEKKADDKEQQELIEKETFKPKHQLSRTPPNKRLEKPLEIEHTIQPQSHSEPAQKETTISPLNCQGITEENINWEEYTAQLVSCKKCKRTFLPNRIQKHEACCKKT
ncbi:PREDICTED: uncharacterized protein LOC105566347 [Vollenhovia emeryi]|uniref:uncharacterized protein LOC105566347 n=1 Tax=Vollenhovia emeryi TaxID=411798 RepID=UPI0005F3A683|nr:PREDICTED: uncharacterized protein LOC105566347 [Vollenhovia emeryi]